MSSPSERGIVGFLAEFDSPGELRRGVEGMRAGDATPCMEAFSPYPLKELDLALGRPKSRVPVAMFVGAVVGIVAGYGMQHFAMAIDYPLNVGGRPLRSWPAFVPVTFELMILFAALAGFVGWLAACRLPRPYHPVLNAARYRAAGQNGFFLLVYAPDAGARRDAIRQQLLSLRPASVEPLYP